MVTFDRVKKTVVIAFLCSFLLANTELNQLFKLPTLIEHYLEHKQENNTETFLHYLSQHYAAKINHSHNDNHHDHEKLPFKTDDCSFAHFSHGFVYPLQFTLSEPYVSETKQNLIFQTNSYVSNFFGNIWQPPRFC